MIVERPHELVKQEDNSKPSEFLQLVFIHREGRVLITLEDSTQIFQLAQKHPPLLPLPRMVVNLSWSDSLSSEVRNIIGTRCRCISDELTKPIQHEQG